MLILFIFVLIIIVSVLIVPSLVRQLFYPLKYKELVFEYSEKNDIDPYLVMSIMKVESRFNPLAVSHKDAKGLMQLTDQTAKWGAEELGMDSFSVEEAFEPTINIEIACWYIKTLMAEFNNKTQLVLAAYNGGSGNVTKWLGDEKLSKTGEVLDEIPFKETKKYVDRVNKEYRMYKKLYKQL